MSASFEIEVDDGDIDIYQTKAKNLIIQSDDGRVELDLLKTDSPNFDITTEDGDVYIDLKKGFSTSFYIHSTDGRLVVDLSEVDNYKENRYSKSGEIGGGKGRIKVYTSDGDITLREIN